MTISLVIATHNRAASLRETLESLVALTIPPGDTWELIVIDNASSDGTAALCEEWKSRLPLHSRFIAEPGKSKALNAVFPELTSDLVLLTDDDVTVDAGWLAGIAAAARRHPECDFFGGKVISRWQAEPPAWFRENAGWLKSNPVVDWGDAPIVLAGIKARPLIGANLAYRTAVFREGLRYPEGEGMKGREGDKGFRRGAEEFLPQIELLTAGKSGLYVPDAIIFHRDPPDRLTQRYVWLWYREMGRQEAAAGERPDDANRWFGAPRYLWGEVMRYSLAYLASRGRQPSERWVRAYTNLASAWGALQEFRRRGRSPA